MVQHTRPRGEFCDFFFTFRNLTMFTKKSVKGTVFCHKLGFSNSYIYATQWCTPLKYQTMNFIRSNNLSLKYKMYSPSGKLIFVSFFLSFTIVKKKWPLETLHKTCWVDCTLVSQTGQYTSKCIYIIQCMLYRLG